VSLHLPLFIMADILFSCSSDEKRTRYERGQIESCSVRNRLILAIDHRTLMSVLFVVSFLVDFCISSRLFVSTITYSLPLPNLSRINRSFPSFSFLSSIFVRLLDEKNTEKKDLCLSVCLSVFFSTGCLS
jgi:hypothetical protein